MSIKVYYHTKNKGLRYVNSILEEYGLASEKIDIVEQGGISFDFFKKILQASEEGVSDVLATRSKPYHKLKGAGVDIDELTISELYALVSKNPALLKSPITMQGNKLVIGYEPESFSVFKDRRMKKNSFLDTLLVTDQLSANHCPEDELLIS